VINEDWLNSLKVGDEVCYSTRWNGYIITKIAKITPTGQIKTEDGRTFKGGWCRVNTWESYFLREVTEKVRDSILASKLIGHMKSVDWYKVPLDKLKLVYKVLKDSESTESTKADKEV
jgi:hypothetical protein